jgi:hypothetical protein
MDRLDFTLAELKFASGDEAPARAFSGDGAVFRNLDSYGDVIAKGAFKRTLRDYRQPIACRRCWRSTAASCRPPT